MKETSMLLLSWCSLCIAFWNYKVPWFLIAYLNLSLATHISDEKFSSRKLLVLHWKSSNIASFTEHPVYIIFNVENVLSLACCFWFDTSCSNSMFKTYLFLNFMCSTKEASIFCFLYSTLYLFSIFNVQIVLILDCWFYFVTSYPNSTCKMFIFSKL